MGKKKDKSKIAKKMKKLNKKMLKLQKKMKKAGVKGTKVDRSDNDNPPIGQGST
jgi:hypothetical protein